jgi:hypothetical protein
VCDFDRESLLGKLLGLWACRGVAKLWSGLEEVDASGELANSEVCLGFFSTGMSNSIAPSGGAIAMLES